MREQYNGMCMHAVQVRFPWTRRTERSPATAARRPLARHGHRTPDQIPTLIVHDSFWEIHSDDVLKKCFLPYIPTIETDLSSHHIRNGKFSKSCLKKIVYINLVCKTVT